jgi:hypothetical protein
VGVPELIIKYRKSGTIINIVIVLGVGILRREPTTVPLCTLFPNLAKSFTYHCIMDFSYLNKVEQRDKG